MVRNPADAETDATEYCCMEEIFRRPRNSPPSPRSSSLVHHRSVRGESCARCTPSTIQGENHEGTRRKRRPKTGSQVQHCPSCHCPPENFRSSGKKYRNSENVEAVLERFEQSLADPYQNTNNLITPPSPKSATHCHSASAKNATSSNHNKSRKTDNDQSLEAMFNDLVNAGLANEETQGCYRHHQGAPIKSVRKKSIPRDDRRGRDASEPDSDYVSKYFREYKNLNRQASNNLQQHQEVVLQQRDNIQQQHSEATQREEGVKENDEEWQELERDRREMDDLDHEIRKFEKHKERQRSGEDRLRAGEERLRAGQERQRAGQEQQRDEDEQEWSQVRRMRMDNEDEDQLKRKVNFQPSKLPVPLCGHIRPQSWDNAGSRSPQEQVKCAMNKMEASTSYHSIPNVDNNADEEFNANFEYAKGDDLDHELKDIPYCKPCRFPSISSTKENRAGENITAIASLQHPKGKPQDLGTLGTIKKSAQAGGDLDLHASKSYIVDLIDRALSRELGTIPEERKGDCGQGSTQQEICVEITRALQGDCCQSYVHGLGNAQETPDYVRQLKVLRWEYLNHIQEELRKLQDLERFLDTCSPRQSLPVLHSQSSTVEQKKEHQTAI